MATRVELFVLNRLSTLHRRANMAQYKGSGWSKVTIAAVGNCRARLDVWL
jgi:hypothetical protein